MGSDVSGVGRLGRGARSWALRAFLLFCFTARSREVRVRIELAIVSEDARES